MTIVEELAGFVGRASWEELSAETVEALKIRILDALGCALGALGAGPVGALRAHTEEMGGRGACTLVGGGTTAPDRATLYNGFCVRYLDFNDSYLAPGETCHPSDNLAAVLACADAVGASGREVLTALGCAYQLQCRLSDEAPVRAKGFDHTTHLAYSAAAASARALGLDVPQIANAVAIAGTSMNALRVTRTGALSHWKGLAAPWAAHGGCQAALLAGKGITGPAEVFEGNKGFSDAIAGPFEIRWDREGLDRVSRTILKRFNAEIHSQSAIEGLLELRREHGIDPRAVERIEVEIFDVAYDIIGGGEEGDKTIVRTKEEADHSLQYMLAVALLDGGVFPEQYRPERIAADDVQDLLLRVEVRPARDLSDRFPREHACRIRLHLAGGRVLERDKRDYEGFHTRPAAWSVVREKFDRLATACAPDRLRDEIAAAVEGLEGIEVRELMEELARVETPEGRT